MSLLEAVEQVQATVSAKRELFDNAVLDGFEIPKLASRPDDELEVDLEIIRGLVSGETEGVCIEGYDKMQSIITQTCDYYDAMHA